jgi:hypothetical protein
MAIEAGTLIACASWSQLGIVSAVGRSLSLSENHIESEQ